MAVDWGAGRYETTAEQLQPVAVALVAAAAVKPGEDVLDVGCGTGNAALLAAAAGAHAVGVDPAQRLIGVARERASQDGLDAEFLAADAIALPFEDASFDVVMSVFGVIFAVPAQKATAEMLRVLRPGGRILLTVWTDTGPLAQTSRLAGQMVAEVLGVKPASPVGWGDPERLRELFAPAGVSVAAHSIAFTAPSPEAWSAAGEDHPLAVAGRAVLEPAGRWQELNERMAAMVAAANEDPLAFRTTSHYSIVTVTPPAANRA